jgi:SAM-dependent methyltransferase
METSFKNSYEDDVRAWAYSELEFPGTYYLAFRDIPEILTRHIDGDTALDFGCGTGRSTRFLKDQRFSAVGVDISAAMLVRAAELDPDGEYQLVADGDLSALGSRRFDLVLCAFTFDNVTADSRHVIFSELRDRLKDGGRIVNLVSAPEIYVNEWASFSTRDFDENRTAQTGDIVRIVMLDVPDRRPVQDVFWTDSDYRSVFDAAGLDVLEHHAPLGLRHDPFVWVSEETISPWAIYVLGKRMRISAEIA